MSGYTKGPWKFGVIEWDENERVLVEKPFDYSGPGYYGNPSILTESGTEIVGCDEYNVFNNPDDTRLMCAAPELLEAAIDFLGDTMRDPQPLRDAIAKAKGLKS